MNEEELNRAREAIEDDPRIRMAIDAARQSEASRTYQVKDCPHFGIVDVVGSADAKWCPDCFRMFPEGRVLYGDQREEGKWVLVVPPSVMDQFKELVKQEEE